MTGSLLLGAAIATTTGYLVLGWLSPAPATWPLRTVRAGMAVVTGMALHSLWQLVWVARVAGTGPHVAFFAYDLALPVLLGVARVAVRSKVPAARDQPGVSAHQAGWLPVGAGIACGIGTAMAWTLARVETHGAWDAWAMWNFKARWLALGGTPWSEILTNTGFATAHPDYPLLLPLSVSRLWLMTGGVPTAVPQAIGVCAGALAAVLLMAAAWSLRGPTSAAVAGAALLALPPFLAASASQLADVPLACCYLATIVALATGMQTGATGRWFAVAGLCAGAAMWTKNEGTLFAVCALVSLLGTAIRAPVSRRESIVRIGQFVAGMAPFLIATFVLRLVAIENDLVAGQSAAATWARVTTVGRHAEILRHGLSMMKSLPDVIGVICFAGYLAFRGVALDLRSAGVVASTLGLTACGYYALYVVTPYELSWHLTTSADRLVVQLWPSVVFAALLITQDERPAITPDSRRSDASGNRLD